MSVTVLGLGSALPQQAVSNDQLSAFLETSDEWIQSRTGIQERRLLAEESLSELAAAAGRQALERAGIAPDELSLIICATCTPDHLLPSLACQVQQALGAGCPAFDLNAACSGFLYGLDVAAAYLTRDPGARVLLIGAEAMSRAVNWQDRATCVLFGDGAGAVLLTGGEDLLSIRLSARGEDRMMVLPGLQGNSPFSLAEPRSSWLHMQGQEVYRFAVQAVVEELTAAIAAAGLGPEDIDLVLLHQANQRIIEAAAERLPIPGERFASNIRLRGNSSAASIPVLLDELYAEGRLRPGMVLALCAFGGGLTTGACVLRWQGPSVNNRSMEETYDNL